MHKPPSPTVPATLGERIAHCRERRAWKQKELAERARVSITFLSEVENNHRSMGSDILLRIAEALGVSVDYLLKGEVEPSRPREPLLIPPELTEAAEERGWSVSHAMDLLKANQLVIGRRSRDPNADRRHKVLSKEEWIDLDDRLFKIRE